ncbi:ABC transporter ATP-binding protein, partial [Actinomycetospora sp.]|uniref:ABC transporter ATP-binding protein n=1 Tax=Actinomycetospora sp. TaxID=1872135 RepID=UPI002F3E7DC6
IQSGALLAVLIAGAAFIATGELTVGGLFGFAAYLGYLYPPLSQLGSLHLMVTSASASCERLVEILDAEPDVGDAPGADDAVVTRGHLELRDVRYVYPGTEDAGLDGVSLVVQPGQFVLVTGPSGAGKSTLTRMLLRFVDAQDGAVLLDGTDVRGRTISAVREAVTLLPQEPMLFDLTVAENIAYARPEATRAEVERAAREAGALDFVRDLPQGFDTPVGEGGSALSGGQRQRVAIARALLRTSPVLVLDEPTTGLDGPTARAVLEPLRRLAGGRTTIVVSHDLTPAREADLVVVLDGGRIVARGRHHELLAAPGIYARLWAAQHGTGARDGAGSAPAAAAPDDDPVTTPTPRGPARLTATGPGSLDPGAARTPDPVTAPLRLLARSSTTTGPTPIRPRPAPPSRAATGPGAAGAPSPARHSAAGPRAAAPVPAAASSYAPRPAPSTSSTPGAPPAASRQASPAQGLPPTPTAVPPTPAVPATSGTRPSAPPGTPASTTRSSPTGPGHVAPAPHPARNGAAWTVPGPRDPASGPTPASRDRAQPPFTGRLARRTVADLVAGANHFPAGATHRRETRESGPRAASGSHRAGGRT